MPADPERQMRSLKQRAAFGAAVRRAAERRQAGVPTVKSHVIRIDDDVYRALAAMADGYETPSNTIRRLLAERLA
jgi:uncharacterized protein (DUF4415 family)